MLLIRTVFQLSVRSVLRFSNCGPVGAFAHRPQAWRNVSFDAGHGKGSHGRLYYGSRFTTLKDRLKEIGPGLLKAMLDQLGLTKKDLENR